MKSKFNLNNIIAYVQGWIRFYLYYHPRLKFLIRKHIREQIDFRIKYMDKECYENGSCKLCGCATTALQMANKSCDKPCYPPILDKDIWNNFINGNYPIYYNKLIWTFQPKLKEIILRFPNSEALAGIIYPREEEEHKEHISKRTRYYKITAFFDKEGQVINE